MDFKAVGECTRVRLGLATFDFNHVMAGRDEQRHKCTVINRDVHRDKTHDRDCLDISI